MQHDDKSLHEKIGYMRAGISNVTDRVNTVLRKVEDVDDKIANLSTTTVRHEQCDSRTAKIERKIDQVIYELSKKQTRQELQTISRSSAEFRSPAEVTDRVSVDELQKTSFQRSVLASLKENAVAITAIIGLITVASVGFLKLARFVVRVETILEENKNITETQTRKLKAEIKRIDERPKVVYVPVKPDAAVPSKTRRVRRRPSRRPTSRAAGAPTSH